MSEPLSIASQLYVTEPVFLKWLKQPLSAENSVLDALADLLDATDCDPERLFLCQYLPADNMLLFFHSGGRNLDDAAPLLTLFKQLAASAGDAGRGHVVAGRYPFGELAELATWTFGKGRLRKVARLPDGALAELSTLLNRLVAWAPEQHRHGKALYHRKIALHLNKRGNAFVRRATPVQPLWFGDDYITDGRYVYWKCFQPQADRRVQGADPWQFRRVAGCIWGDGSHLYYKQRCIAALQGRARVVGQAVVVGHHAYFADRDSGDLYCDEVDPLRFKRLCSRGDYYSDGCKVWCGMKLLPEAPNAFDVLGAGIARGRHAVYRHGSICEGVDPASLVELGSGFFQDHQYLWFHDLTGSLFTKLACCASGAPKVVGPWCIAGSQVWFNEHLLAGADPASFRPVTASHAADASHVWCQQRRVEDPERSLPCAGRGRCWPW